MGYLGFRQSIKMEQRHARVRLPTAGRARAGGEERSPGSGMHCLHLLSLLFSP